MFVIQKLGKLKKNPDPAESITTIEFNIFSGEIFNSKVKRAKLATNKDLTIVEQYTIEIKKQNLETCDF